MGTLSVSMTTSDLLLVYRVKTYTGIIPSFDRSRNQGGIPARQE